MNVTKSFLDELSGPFVPPRPLKPGVVTITTELPKLLKLTIEALSQDKLDRLIDVSDRMNKNQLKKIYRIKHSEEYRRFGGTPTGKQLRLLRFAASLLEKEV